MKTSLRSIPSLLVPALLFLALLYLGTAPAADAQTTRPKDGEKPPAADAARTGGMIDVGAFHAPAGKDWTHEEPSNRMRVAQLTLPGPKDSADAELVVFHFGADQGGAVRANIERWKGQFGRPEGMSDEEFAKETKLDVHGQEVTVLEVRGRYAPAAMGPRPAPKPIEDARLYAAIVQTDGGSYFVKATGPRETIEHHRKALEAMVAGIRKGPAPKKGTGKGAEELTPEKPGKPQEPGKSSGKGKGGGA